MIISSIAFAQTNPAGTAAGSAGPAWPHLLIMVGGVFAIFYFLMIRPQMKEEKKRKELLTQLQKNDTVLTSSGFLANVHQVKEEEVVLKLDEKSDTKVRCLKSAIVKVVKTQEPVA